MCKDTIFITIHYICFVKTYFSKTNYLLLIFGFLLVVLGYLLMSGGGSQHPEVFNPEIFSAQRITWAPITCLAGFITILFGIMYRKSSSDSNA